MDFSFIPTVKELGYDVKAIVAALVDAIEKAVKDPEYIKFAVERNTRWEYVPPANVVPVFDKRRAAVREIMSKAGILKDAK